MTPLRQRMLDSMLQCGFSQRTQGCYVEAISRMARHYRGDPAQLTPEEVSKYLLYMVKERHLSFSTVNQAASACRFLYERVLGRSSEGIRPPMARVPQKQPHLLAREEIARLLSCCARPAYRMGLQIMYASGLRVSEVCALTVRDIDSAANRMCVRVNADKGGADRYSLLSPTLLELLRQYCRTHAPHKKPGGWLFPNSAGTRCTHIENLQRAYQAARHCAGISKPGGTHTLSHCFATHLLEGGTDLFTISRLLGHGYLTTTSRCLHLTSPQFRPPKGIAPLHLLAGLHKL